MGASLMHVPTHWIVVGALVLVGLGILTDVKATRQKDSATIRPRCGRNFSMVGAC
jgi:hypothetical protein